MQCFKYQLKLSAANTFKFITVHNLMDRIRKIKEFFNYSETREQVLEKFVDLLKLKDFLLRRLQDVCRTRWVSRIFALETFLEFYEALVRTSEEIFHNEKGKFNQDSVQKAFCFLSLITTFDFIVTVVLFYHIMVITLPANILLKSVTIDILQEMKLIRALMNICSNMRHHIYDDHKKWYKEAILIAAKRYIRESSKSLLKANKQSKSAIKYSK